MSRTRGQIKAQLQTNLFELGFNFYSDNDFNNAIQDAYDDVVVLSQCIQRRIELPWISNLSYYDFRARYNLNDYLGTIAIFNKVTNLWLRDDLSLKDFDRIRRNWETWIGTPLFWAPSDFKNIAICPKYFSIHYKHGAFDYATFDNDAFNIDNYNYPNGRRPIGSFFPTFDENTFDVYGNAWPDKLSLGDYILFYWAIAPTLTSDDDTFLIASDNDTLLVHYATADLLEQAQEFNKANVYWNIYHVNLDQYADRVKRINKADLLLRI